MARARAVESFGGMPGPLRGLHRLADESLWTLGASVAVLDTAGADAQVVVANGAGAVLPGDTGRWRSGP
jgi:hypothetical protein